MRRGSARGKALRQGCFRAAMGIAALAIAGALAPASAQAACKVEKYADLPVTMDGMQPLVAAKINGVDVSFIVDRGAFYSLMSTGVAGRPGLKLARVPPDQFQLVGAGGATNAAIAKVKDLVVAGIPIHNLEFF